MGIPVRLEVFEGPLDLLLYLIDKNKLDIYDIPIVLITEQYMEYIKNMQSRDMDVMSEFLVMAATLVRIKSKMLLPKDENREEEEDPRQELVERLLEYKMYKYMSYELKDRQLDAQRVLFKQPTIPEEIKNYEEEVNVEELMEDITLAKLQQIFQSVIKKQVEKIDPIRSEFGRIEKEEVTLADRMIYIQQFASAKEKNGEFSFRDLLESQSTKIETIVTFLGVLELMKIGVIQIKQEILFDDISITYTGKEVDLSDWE
ncbi:MAG: segregation/condensation protein A [Lachnospiraceae bacterium]|nr:segregation/condensation protein A [Lachnospiraceae bacterium]